MNRMRFAAACGALSLVTLSQAACSSAPADPGAPEATGAAASPLLNPEATWGIESLYGTAIAEWSPGRLDGFFVDASHALEHVWSDDAGATWSGPENLGGYLTSAPAAVAWGPRRLDVFVRGGDSALYHKWYDGSGFSGWEYMGGTLADGPAVASWGVGRLDVFYPGSDHSLRHRWYEGGWSGEESLGGICTSAPSATSWGVGRLDIVVRNTSYEISHRAYQGGWADWDGIGVPGAAVLGAPSISSTGANQLDVFWIQPGRLAPGNEIYRERWADGWQTPEYEGNKPFSAIASVSNWNRPAIDLFLYGAPSYLQTEKWSIGNAPR